MVARAADLANRTQRNATERKDTIMVTTNTNNTNQSNTGSTGTAANATAPVITNVTNTKVDSEAEYQTLVAGMLANLGDESSVSLNGGTFAIADLVTRFQGVITAAEKSKASKNQWRMDVESERLVEVSVSPLRKSMRRFLEGRYGEGSVKLAEFGFTPRKPRVVSAATKAEAAIKAKATKKARNTVGKKQREAITATQPAAPAAPQTPGATLPPAAPVASTPAPAAPTAPPAQAGSPRAPTGGAS
jgi:hypothetical protein